MMAFVGRLQHAEDFLKKIPELPTENSVVMPRPIVAIFLKEISVYSEVYRLRLAYSG
jgi:hypothetical protein